MFIKFKLIICHVHVDIIIIIKHSMRGNSIKSIIWLTIGISPVPSRLKAFVARVVDHQCEHHHYAQRHQNEL